MASLRSSGPALFGLALLAAAPALAQTVPVTPFDSIELEGGGHIDVRHGDTQQARIVSGSAAYTRFAVDQERKLHIEDCYRPCPAHYDLQVEITTPHIEGLAISGGGAIVGMDGFPPPKNLALAVKGGGMVDTRALNAEEVSAGIEGGGMIKLRASGKLTAAVDGGGLISYWGDPTVTRAVNGGGAIERGL